MNLNEMLSSQGFEVVGTASDGFEAIEECKKHRADVLLLDIKMPVLDGLTAAQCIYEEGLADTVIIVTAYSEDVFLDKANRVGVAGYLVKPISEKDIAPCLNIAIARSQELKKLRVEIDQVNRTLEARKVIERAKGLLMNKKGISEPDAFNFIRDISKNRNISMRKVAEVVLKEFESEFAG
jgi:response regulator NasT